MISFYPGPSRVYDQVPTYVKEAHEQGLLSANHRSPEFMELARSVKQLLHSKLLVPGDYKILFTSSATECWEIIAQSLTRQCSQHYYNGAFGKKWFGFAKAIVPSTIESSFEIQCELPSGNIDQKADCICVTHSETSNGTAIDLATLSELQKLKSEESIIAVDGTSSMAGVRYDFDLADVWYASIQKCFGLPAGMGILIVSPKAIERAEQIGDVEHYNSILKILENESKDQTHYTPNVLAIYLLKRTLENNPGIETIDKLIQSRYVTWEQIVHQSNDLDWLVSNVNCRSTTVLALKHPDPDSIKAKAREAGYILGNGYGPWSDNTFRIANYPALSDEETVALQNWIVATCT